MIGRIRKQMLMVSHGIILSFEDGLNIPAFYSLLRYRANYPARQYILSLPFENRLRIITQIINAIDGHSLSILVFLFSTLRLRVNCLTPLLL
jgi:hypothetical protein